MEEKNTDISERVILIINILGETRNSFSKKLGYIKSQNIYDITNAKSAPSFDFFQKLMNSEYSEKINLTWLITGEGEMLKKSESTSTNIDEIAYLRKKNEEKDAVINQLNQEIGMLKAQLGNHSNYVHQEENVECADAEKHKQVG